MKNFRYVFINKTCPVCGAATVEDFSVHRPCFYYSDIKRSGCYCSNPDCRTAFYFRMSPLETVWIARVAHILHSEEKEIIREIQKDELVRKHGVDEWWLHIKRKIYLEPEKFMDKDLKDFREKNHSDTAVLAYLPNSHLQRLYFMIPRDAIS
jgi:hypothetical protein